LREKLRSCAARCTSRGSRRFAHRPRHAHHPVEEGFADAVRFHPKYKQSPRPLTELVPEFMAGPTAALRAAAARGNQPDFVAAHDALTEGCNACHVATEFSFNVVVRPTFNPYSNQAFEPPR